VNGRNQTQSVTKVLPGIPPSANVLKRKYRNPHAYARLRDMWQRLCWAFIQGSDRQWLMAMADLKKRMRVDVNFAHTKLDDPDNLPGRCKVLLDGLVRLQFLANDDPLHIELHVTQIKIRQNETTLVIREAAELFPDVLRTKDDK
jgi:hypothetical protein